MPAKYDYIIEQREAVGHALVEYFAVGGCEYHLVVVAAAFQLAYAAVDGFDLYDHAGIAAEGIVVDFAVAVGRVISQVMHLDFA